MPDSGLQTVLAEAHRLAATPRFRRSEQLRLLLLYLAEHSASSDSDCLSEKAIGEQVFGRRNFDPRIDTIVRTQARRLRRKLDDHYESETPPGGLRLVLSSHPYELRLAPLEAPVPPAALDTPNTSNTGWRPYLWGALFGAGLCLAVAIIVSQFQPTSPQTLSPIAAHPFWRPFFRSGQPGAIAVATPLFVRGARGFYRDFRLNDPDQVQRAEEFFGKGMYWPASDPWVNLSDLRATLRLAGLFRPFSPDSGAVLDGREITQDLALKKDLILIGHPKGIPWLVEAMSGMNFQFAQHTPGAGWFGISNRQPRHGESPAYLPAHGNEVQTLTATFPEYALITRHRMSTGTHWLSTSAGRSASVAYLLERLQEEAFLSALGKLLPPSWAEATTLQLLYEVRYVNRNQMTAKLVTFRVDP